MHLNIKECLSNNTPFSTYFLREVHSLLLDRIIEDKGKFRDKEVIITGAYFKPPFSVNVSSLVSDMISSYNAINNQFEKAAFIHTEFIRIHLFTDGNGRTARMLLNYSLELNGYLPIIINNTDRIKYFEVLDVSGSQGDIEPFYKFIIDKELGILEEYLEHFSNNTTLK